MKGIRIVLLSLLTAGAAGAKPSFWDRVRDPSEDRAYRALVQAVRARTPGDIPIEALPAFDSLLSMRAAAVLEMAGGAALRSPDVWFFLGTSLIAANRGRDEDGRALLERAIRADPDSPEVANAWFDIAIASNRMRDFEKEREAYDEALRVQWDRDKRAGIHLNRGESNMSLKDLSAAREDYSTALALSSDSEIHALSHWGLAVALARDDDLPEALQHALEASRMQFRSPDGSPISALELPGVFFTPDYEIHYYRALAAMAAADQAKDAASRRAAFGIAILQWQEYLAGARPARDAWIANVESELRYCERRFREPGGH